VWAFVVEVFDDFQVELESRMFEVVGSEPSFDLARVLRGIWVALGGCQTFSTTRLEGDYENSTNRERSD